MGQGRYSKVLAKIVEEDPRLTDYSFEGVDGHWFYTKPGYFSHCTNSHVFHELTVRGMLEALSEGIGECPSTCYCLEAER